MNSFKLLILGGKFIGILTVWSGKLIIWNNYKFVLLVQKCNLFVRIVNLVGLVYLVYLVGSVDSVIPFSRISFQIPKILRYVL